MPNNHTGVSVPDHLVQVFEDLFVNSKTHWSKQIINAGGKCFYMNYKPDDFRYSEVDHRLLNRHLAGSITIALPALNEPGLNATSKWLCFDSDTDNGDLEKLEQLFTQFNWATFREGKRLGRAGHLWIFFSEPVPTIDAIAIGKRFLDACQVTVEMFPKSNTGWSQLRAPLGYHAKPDALCFSWFENCTDKDTINQITWLSKQHKVDATTVKTFAAKIRAEEPKPIPRKKILFSGKAKGRIDFKQVNTLALRNIDLVIQQWLPGGKHCGKEYNALNPKRKDQSLGSFSINLNTGIWADFAINRKGDLIDLVAYLDDIRNIDAARKLSGFLGNR